MADNFSEQAIKKKCPHCDLNGWAFHYLLKQTSLFSVLCDAHPLVEGHYLFLSMNKRMWTIAPSLGAPPFFRDRFAQALKSTKSRLKGYQRKPFFTARRS